MKKDLSKKELKVAGKATLDPKHLQVYLRAAAASILQNEIYSALEKGEEITVIIGGRRLCYTENEPEPTPRKQKKPRKSKQKP